MESSGLAFVKFSHYGNLFHSKKAGPMPLRRKIGQPSLGRLRLIGSVQGFLEDIPFQIEDVIDRDEDAGEEFDAPIVFVDAPNLPFRG